MLVLFHSNHNVANLLWLWIKFNCSFHHLFLFSYLWHHCEVILDISKHICFTLVTSLRGIQWCIQAYISLWMYIYISLWIGSKSSMLKMCMALQIAAYFICMESHCNIYIVSNNEHLVSRKLFFMPKESIS